MSAVSVYTYTHSVTYVADNILKSFREIIRLSGLNPKELSETWESKLRALSTWIESKDLEKVILEIYHPVTGGLIVRWDLDIVYNWSTDEGTFTPTPTSCATPFKKRAWCQRKPNTTSYSRQNGGAPMFKAGDLWSFVPRLEWSSKASGRPSNTMAWVPRPRTGEKHNADRQ